MPPTQRSSHEYWPPLFRQARGSKGPALRSHLGRGNARQIFPSSPQGLTVIKPITPRVVRSYDCQSDVIEDLLRISKAGPVPTVFRETTTTAFTGLEHIAVNWITARVEIRSYTRFTTPYGELPDPLEFARLIHEILDAQEVKYENFDSKRYAFQTAYNEREEIIHEAAQLIAATKLPLNTPNGLLMKSQLPSPFGTGRIAVHGPNRLNLVKECDLLPSMCGGIQPNVIITSAYYSDTKPYVRVSMNTVRVMGKFVRPDTLSIMSAIASNPSLGQ